MIIIGFGLMLGKKLSRQKTGTFATLTASGNCICSCCCYVAQSYRLLLRTTTHSPLWSLPTTNILLSSSDPLKLFYSIHFCKWAFAAIITFTVLLYLDKIGFLSFSLLDWQILRWWKPSGNWESGLWRYFLHHSRQLTSTPSRLNSDKHQIKYSAGVDLLSSGYIDWWQVCSY